MRAAECALFRLWAWLAALLVVGAPLARAAHLLLVPHTVCEHGELVHAPHSAATERPPSRAAVRGDASGDADGSLDHDHCLTVGQSSHDATATVPAPTVLLDVPPAGSPHSSAISLADPRAILDRAPKTSPPSV
jgi:hypothetical protein